MEQENEINEINNTACKPEMAEMPEIPESPDIDLVYLYVNSEDPEWRKEREKYADDFNNGPWRYRDNRELLWSLRSVEKHAPWIRNIFIVSNSSMPEWLNTAHPKLHVIDHSVILPKEYLPCFNCNVIEAHLSNIPGLSEWFLYANDDTYFGNDVSPGFFVREGKPVLRMQKMGFDPEQDQAAYFPKVVSNAFRLAKKHYGRAFRYMPWHNIDIYKKSAFERCRLEYADELTPLYSNRLRSDHDIERVLFQYDLLMHDECFLEVYDRSDVIKKSIHTLQLILRPAEKLDFAVCGIHLLFKIPFLKNTLPVKPRCVCLNDDEWTTEKDLKKYRQLMERIFPEKSSFENV